MAPLRTTRDASRIKDDSTMILNDNALHVNDLSNEDFGGRRHPPGPPSPAGPPSEPPLDTSDQRAAAAGVNDATFPAEHITRGLPSDITIEANVGERTGAAQQPDD